MKKILISLTVITSIVISSCSNSETGGGNESGDSNDVAAIEITSIINNFEAGLVPFLPIKDIGNYNIAPTEKGEWEYISEEENEGVKIIKVYKKHHSNKDKISSYRVEIYMNSKLGLDYDAYETDEEIEKAEVENEKNMKEFEDKYYNLMNTKLPNATYELFNGAHSWIIAKGDYEYHISISFSYYDLSVSVW